MSARAWGKALSLAGFAAIACGVYGTLIEPRMLKIRHINVGQGEHVSRIAHLSDIHMGGFHMGPKRLDAIIKRVNNLDADIVIMTGDYISGHIARAERPDAEVAQIASGVSQLGRLQAKRGVYATLGNHDNWYDGDSVDRMLSQAGLTVLDNEHAVIGDTICLVGLADHDTASVDRSSFDGCNRDIQTDGQLTIIAAMHSPDSFRDMSDAVALGLAGHTHGGQVNLPLIGRRVTATKLGKPYAYGLKMWGQTPVYITSGLGTSILPVRFRAVPEIALIHLAH